MISLYGARVRVIRERLVIQGRRLLPSSVQQQENSINQRASQCTIPTSLAVHYSSSTRVSASSSGDMLGDDAFVWREHEHMLRKNFVAAAVAVEFNQDHSGLPTDAQLVDLERKLGHIFTNRSLLVLALSHRSAANPNSRVLSWMGDAALQLAVTEQLAGVYGCLSPGDLTRMRCELVSRENCNRNALMLGLENVLVFGKGVLVASGKPSDAMLAEAFEAVIGAVYVDGGMEAVRRAYGQNFPLPHLETLSESMS